MDNLTMIVITLGAICAVLFFTCLHLMGRISAVELTLRNQETAIQDLYKRKEDKKPGFEMVLTSKEQSDAMVRKLEELGSVVIKK